MRKVVVDHRVIIVVCLAVAGGLCLQQISAPPAKPERPVLKFVAKVAKLGLWLLVVQDDRPANIYAARAPHVHHVNDQGERVLNHGEGW